MWTGQGTEANASQRTLRGSNNALYAVDISPDGRTIAGAGHDKRVYLWDNESQQPYKTLLGHTGSIESLAFHPHGHLLASGASDGTVRLWDLSNLADTTNSLAEHLVPDEPIAVIKDILHAGDDIAFSPDGHILACVCGDLSIHLWDVTRSHQPQLVDVRKTVRKAGEQNIFAIAFSPDGTKLACGGNYRIHLWDLADDCTKNTQQPQTEKADSGAPLILEHHTSRIFAVAFSPDSATLASGSEDYTACLWDVESGALDKVLGRHTEPVYGVAFTPDGAFLLSCSADGTIRFWDVQTGACVSTLIVEGPYSEMNIRGVTGITEAQKEALKTLGAVETNF